MPRQIHGPGQYTFFDNTDAKPLPRAPGAPPDKPLPPVPRPATVRPSTVHKYTKVPGMTHRLDGPAPHIPVMREEARKQPAPQARAQPRPQPKSQPQPQPRPTHQYQQHQQHPQAKPLDRIDTRTDFRNHALRKLEGRDARKAPPQKIQIPPPRAPVPRHRPMTYVKEQQKRADPKKGFSTFLAPGQTPGVLAQRPPMPPLPQKPTQQNGLVNGHARGQARPPVPVPEHMKSGWYPDEKKGCCVMM